MATGPSNNARWRTILRSPSIRSLMRLAVGTTMGQLIMLAATPFITRLYLPEDFSCLGLFLAFLSVALVFATMKYESAIVSADSTEDAEYLLLACLAISLPVAVAAACIMYVVVAAGLFGFTGLPAAAVWLMVPAVTLAAAIATTREWMVREKQIAGLSNSLIVRAGGRCATQVGLGIVGAGWAGLIVAEIVARAVGCSICLESVWPALLKRVKMFRVAGMLRVLEHYRRFPLLCLPSTLVNTVALALPIPLIIVCYGAGIGGAFVLIQRVLRAPLVLLGRCAADVFHQRMAQSAGRDDHSAVRLIDRTVMRLLALGLIPTIILATTAHRIIPWIFGSDWQEAGFMAAAMAPWLLAQFAVAPISQTMSVYRSHHLKLVYDFASLGAAVASISICSALDHSALTAVRALSWANMATYALYYILARQVARTGRRAESLESIDAELSQGDE